MSDGAVDPHTIFTGSGGSASLVGWIDAVLIELREGRLDDARAALERETWRTAVVEAGLPRPILEQARESLSDAAAALAHPDGSVEDAEAALLIARSRFMPGA